MTAAKALPPILTQEMVKRVLRYEPETGALYWLPRPPSMFPQALLPPDYRAKKWNDRYAGKLAFTMKDRLGYCCGSIFAVQYKAHRIIWLYMTGESPAEIDHINGDTSDNRWQNLRAATRTINARNLKLRKDNKTGMPGISRTASGKYSVTVGVGGETLCLGTFASFEMAKKARQEAQDVYGYHANHGRAEPPKAA